MYSREHFCIHDYVQSKLFVHVLKLLVFRLLHFAISNIKQSFSDQYLFLDFVFFMRVHHDITFPAHLSTTGQCLATLPLFLTSRTTKVAKHSFLTLIDCWTAGLKIKIFWDIRYEMCTKLLLAQSHLMKLHWLPKSGIVSWSNFVNRCVILWKWKVAFQIKRRKKNW